MRTGLWCIGAAAALLCVAGCGGGNEPAAEKPVARIDEYVMTVEDFRAEADRLQRNRELPSDDERAKEQLLEEIVLRKVLLQEAQRQNFDKNRAFMKEIERYWEQALLKLLYRKKAHELAATVSVSEGEVLDEYRRLIEAGDPAAARGAFDEVAAQIRADIANRKTQEAIDGWVDGLRRRARVTVYRENLAETEL